jgi:hypothetical protein
MDTTATVMQVNIFILVIGKMDAGGKGASRVAFRGARMSFSTGRNCTYGRWKKQIRIKPAVTLHGDDLRPHRWRPNGFLRGRYVISSGIREGDLSALFVTG